MKILAIMGSPRKGDSYEIIRLFEEKMKALGQVQVEYLFLKDLHLEICRGCNVCFFKGEAMCPLKDDRAMIEQKIMESDGVIFSSPSYVVNVTGLMKNFIDRFAYRCHRPRFFDKYALLVSCAGGFGLTQTIQAMDWAARTWGFNIVRKLGVLSFRFADESYNRKSRLKIERSAERFYQAIANKEPMVPSLLSVIGFRLQRLYFAKPGEENSDYQYWKQNGWLEPDVVYYCPAKINIFKRVLAPLAFAIMKSRKTF